MNDYSMENYLKVVAPHLHPDLVSPSALCQVQELAEILPPISIAGFECRLASEQPGVDFQINFSCFTPSLAEKLLNHPRWELFQNFYREWADTNSFLHESVNRVWLEFDVSEESFRAQTPCFFIPLERETISENLKLIKIVLETLKYPVASKFESNLKLCVDRLPSGATISYVGGMLSRQTNAVRINLKGIPPEQIGDYLLEIGWSDPTDALPFLASTVSKFVDYIVLTVDIGDMILPKIGLECFLNQQLLIPRWQLFLDYLVEEGLCVPAKREGLLAWSGFDSRNSRPDLWPSNLTWGDRFLNSTAVSVFWRTINHIKIVYQPSKTLEAKAYLAFGHTWLDRNWLKPPNLAKTEENTQNPSVC